MEKRQPNQWNFTWWPFQFIQIDWYKTHYFFFLFLFSIQDEPFVRFKVWYFCTGEIYCSQHRSLYYTHISDYSVALNVDSNLSKHRTSPLHLLFIPLTLSSLCVAHRKSHRQYAQHTGICVYILYRGMLTWGLSSAIIISTMVSSNRFCLRICSEKVKTIIVIIVSASVHALTIRPSEMWHQLSPPKGRMKHFFF